MALTTATRLQSQAWTRLPSESGEASLRHVAAYRQKLAELEAEYSCDNVFLACRSEEQPRSPARNITQPHTTFFIHHRNKGRAT